MEQFWKAVATVLIALVMGIALEKQSKDLGVLLIITVCCAVSVSALSYLKPVLNFLRDMQNLAGFQSELMRPLIRILGIGMASELISTICTDAGSGSYGKVLRILSSAAILSLSIPIFHTVLSVIREILGGI